MGAKTGIQWTDATWNPVAGCTLVSPGCTNCYAMREAHRLARMGVAKYDGLTTLVKGIPVWTGAVRLHEAHLAEPLHWRKPRRIFVNSMSDLFHEDLPDAAIDQVFAVMQRASNHKFQVLTKRADRMRRYVSALYAEADGNNRRWFERGFVWPLGNAATMARATVVPFKNVWLGVSVEDQVRADDRIPLLLETPAAVRFLSCEPLLGPVDLSSVKEQLAGESFQIFDALDHPDTLNRGRNRQGIDWVIAGGESGPGARPTHPDWARALRDQCTAAGVPFFFKQWGEWLDACHHFDALTKFGAIHNHGAIWAPPRPLNFTDAATMAGITHDPFEHQSDGTTMIRVGKKRAGRLLDGREHSEFPR